MNCSVWNLLVHQMTVVVLSQDSPLLTVGSQTLLQNESFNLLKRTGNFTYHQVYLRTFTSVTPWSTVLQEKLTGSQSNSPHFMEPEVRYRVYLSVS